MRQREDKLFAIARNNMASETMTDSDVKLIKSREINNVFLVHLEVDEFN